MPPLNLVFHLGTGLTLQTLGKGLCHRQHQFIVHQGQRLQRRGGAGTTRGQG